MQVSYYYLNILNATEHILQSVEEEAKINREVTCFIGLCDCF